MLNRRGARTDPCGTPFLRRRNLISFAVSGGKGEAGIANLLHDHAEHVSIRQQLQQLAGEAVVLYSVLGCCIVDKHIYGPLISRKAILDVLCQPGDLVYGRPPVSKARLLPKEQWVDDCVDTSKDESLEDFKGDTQQRYGTLTLWVPQWLFWLRVRNF